MRRLVLIAVAVSVLLSVLAGCAPAPTATPTQASPTKVPPTVVPPTAVPPTPTQGPKRGGTLVLAMSSQPDGMFPDYAATATSAYAQVSVYNGLVTQDLDGKTVGDLAESWTVSDDNLTYTFKLRKNVKWHDGKPFTAADVKFSYEFPADKDYTGNGYGAVGALKGAKDKKEGKASEIAGVKVIDDYTIALTVEQPNALFLETVAPRFILPAHVLQSVPVAQLKESSQFRSPIGTGPYKLVEWKADESLTFKANDDYFGPRPYIDTYIWKVMPELPTQVSELLAGGVHGVVLANADDYVTLEKNPGLQAVRVPGVSQSFMAVNISKPMFADKRVRQAFSYAIDKQAMLQALSSGLGTVVVSPVHPSLPEYNPNLKGYPFDQTKAKALLEQAGWIDKNGDGVRESYGVPGLQDGTPFKFRLGSLTIRRYLPQAQIVQQQLKEVGVEATIEQVEFNIFFSKYYLRGLDFDMAGSGWFNLLYHPLTELEWNYTSANSDDMYNNPQVDELVAKAPTVFDAKERQQIFWKIQELIEEDAAKIFLTRDDTLSVFTKKLYVAPYKSLSQLWLTIPTWYFKD